MSKKFEIDQMVTCKDPDWVPTDMLDAALVPAMSHRMPARITKVVNKENGQDVFLAIPGYENVPINAHFLRPAYT